MTNNADMFVYHHFEAWLPASQETLRNITELWDHGTWFKGGKNTEASRPTVTLYEISHSNSWLTDDTNMGDVLVGIVNPHAEEIFIDVHIGGMTYESNVSIAPHGRRLFLRGMSPFPVTNIWPMSIQLTARTATSKNVPVNVVHALVDIPEVRRLWALSIRMIGDPIGGVLNYHEQNANFLPRLYLLNRPE